MPPSLPPSTATPLHRHAPSARRRLAIDLYGAALRGADAGAAVTDALAREPLAGGRGRVWIVAIGKAAHPMASAAVTALAADGRVPAGGLVVAPNVAPPPHDALEAARGDHPLPGPASFEAARRLGLLTTRVAADDEVLVLLSGGATALVGAPVAEVAGRDLVALFDALLASGLDIGAMNALRKRFSRWGGGRLATALAPARVRCLAVSDVAGDDPATIGSGPCVPDPTSAAELLALVEHHALRDRVPATLREHLALVARGDAPETPKPGHHAFARVTTRVILSTRDALEAVARAAIASGCAVERPGTELAGDAATAGGSCAALLLHRAAERRRAGGDAWPPLCVVWGGETTVTLAGGSAAGAGLGGRCQELALAAAGWLHERHGAAGGVTLLAAGTDGRDGPTDAAGAIVDRDTWGTIAAVSLDPAAALARHDSHRALDAAGALLRTGHTGTNVRDVVIGLVTSEE